MVISSLSITAQNVRFSPKNASPQQKSLVKTAMDVSKAIGPAYEIETAASIEISGPVIFESEDERPEIQAHVGESYYTVSFIPENPEEYNFPYLSKVNIWENGEPKDVFFGIGWGRNFFFRSLEEQINDKTFKPVPLEKVTYDEKPVIK